MASARDERIGVLFVCLGNICRSPMAEGVFGHLAAERGVAHRFRVDSAGTAAYHVGEPPDRRTLAVLRRHGIALRSVARQVRADDFEDFAWILAMDRSNRDHLLRIAPDHLAHKVHLALDPVGGGDVTDPYYGGPEGFERNFAQLSEALDAWIDRMLAG